MDEQVKQPNLGEKLQSLPKQWLYGLLVLFIAIPLFFPFKVPNAPDDQTIDYFKALMTLPENSTILLGSDWTNSTRGESAGSAEATLRILMRKRIKFALYSTGDPQAPQAMKDLIARVAEEYQKETGKTYKRYEDWVSFGYYPNSEAQNQSIANDPLKAFAGKTEAIDGKKLSVWDSPVLKDIKSLKDFKLLCLVSPSSTDKITVQRLGGKIALLFAVTGVMVPENQNYYISGQLKGLSGGLKGVYDLETLMENGVNVPGPDGKIVVKTDKFPDQIQGFKGMTNKGKGTLYYPTLHVAIALMVIAIIVGNVGMFLSRRGK